MANPQIEVRTSEKTKRDDLASKAAEAARAGTEKITSLRNQAAENTRNAVRASVDATSESFKQAADQFDAFLGISGEEGKRLAQRSSQNMEAVTQCGRVLTEAAQQLAREWVGLAQKQIKRNTDGMSALAQCRSVQDFVAVQSDLMRDGLRHMIEEGRQVAELATRAADGASKVMAGSAQPSVQAA